LIEAVVLALIGGGMGLLIAASGLALVGLVLPELQVGVQLSSVVLATLISLAVGTFFGIYPANRAAALNPIDALRYE
jgi:putative ABC transport system permease protein